MHRVDPWTAPLQGLHREHFHPRHAEDHRLSHRKAPSGTARPGRACSTCHMNHEVVNSNAGSPMFCSQIPILSYPKPATEGNRLLGHKMGERTPGDTNCGQRSSALLSQIPGWVGRSQQRQVLLCRTSQPLVYRGLFLSMFRS